MECGQCAQPDGGCQCVQPAEMLDFLNVFRSGLHQDAEPEKVVERAREPAPEPATEAVLAGAAHQPLAPYTPDTAVPRWDPPPADIAPPFRPEAAAAWVPPPTWAPPAYMSADAWVAPVATERNRWARPAQVMGLASLVVPLLAPPAVVCGLAALVRNLRRRSVAGRWTALSGLLAAMILAPVGLAVMGNYWAHKASNLTNFGSGTEIQSIPVVDPGNGFAMVTSHSGSDDGGSSPSPANPTTSALPGLSTKQIFHVSNQVSFTGWVNAQHTEARSATVVLTPSPSLGASLYSQLGDVSAREPGADPFPASGPPGVIGMQIPQASRGAVQMVAAEAGSVVVVIDAAGPRPVGQLRADAEQQLDTELSAVPRSASTLDETGDSYEQRHNLLRTVVQDIGVADSVLVLTILALLLAGTVLQPKAARASVNW